MNRVKTLIFVGSPWRSYLESMALGVLLLLLIDFQPEDVYSTINYTGVLTAGGLAATWMAVRMRPSRQPWYLWLLEEGWPAFALPFGLIWIHAILRLAASAFVASRINNSDFMDFAILGACAAIYVGIRVVVIAWTWLTRLAEGSLQWGIVRTMVVAVVIFAGAAVLVVVYPLTVLSNLSAVYSNGARNSVVLSVLVNMLFPNLILAIAVAGLAVLMIILPSIGISYLVSRPLTRRLKTLTAATQALRSGDLQARVAFKGHDEIAQLQDDFNSMAENIQRSNQNLSESRDKIAALLKNQRELTALVSHELRTPIATLRGYLEKSIDGIDPLPESVSQDLEIMHHEVLRLQSLIDDLFTLSRVDLEQLELHIQRVDVCPMVERVVTTLQPVAWKNARVELNQQVPCEHVYVQADEQRLEQILLNLINNAVRHTQPGGLVIVSASTDENFIELAVADTGEGIAAERLPEIWERFNHGSGNGGSGLGLSLVKDLTERMQGQVGVESQPGEGSRFWVRLPRAKPFQGR
jgi:signal transduction histidine kinase